MTTIDDDLAPHHVAPPAADAAREREFAVYDAGSLDPDTPSWTARKCEKCEYAAGGECAACHDVNLMRLEACEAKIPPPDFSGGAGGPASDPLSRRCLTCGKPCRWDYCGPACQ